MNQYHRRLLLFWKEKIKKKNSLYQVILVFFDVLIIFKNVLYTLNDAIQTNIPSLSHSQAKKKNYTFSIMYSEFSVGPVPPETDQ